MTIFITFLTLLELSIFLVYDLRINRGDRSARYAIRLMSSIGGLVLILAEILLPGRLDTPELEVDLSFITAMLVIYPCSFEKPDTSFSYAEKGCALFSIHRTHLNTYLRITQQRR